jgi:ketosteroid isomerase-like protein
MSQDNVEIVRRIYEAFNEGNRRERAERSRYPEFFAPDIELDLSRNVFNPVTDRGYEGIERLVGMVNDVWDDFRFEVEELIDAGDHVVAQVKLLGKGEGRRRPGRAARHARPHDA